MYAHTTACMMMQKKKNVHEENKNGHKTRCSHISSFKKYESFLYEQCNVYVQKSTFRLQFSLVTFLRALSQCFHSFEYVCGRKKNELC